MYQISLKSKKRFVNGRTDGRTYGRAYEHLRPTFLGRLGGFDLKMETRHPVEGPFDREFSAFVIIAEL